MQIDLIRQYTLRISPEIKAGMLFNQDSGQNLSFIVGFSKSKGVETIKFMRASEIPYSTPNFDSFLNVRQNW